jgi:tryptophanyl-tRNA synthetase
MNRSHAYKAAVSTNESKDEDKGITMGLFSYPILMSADILMFNATHVPVGADQLQHIEMTRDIAGRFNHIYKKIFNLPEAIIGDDIKTIPGLDGRKMSKSYKNIIPLLSDEKTLKKSIMKIVTNSLEPGEKKDSNGCTVFSLYSAFATSDEISSLQEKYDDGIGWGDAKNLLYNKINNEVQHIRDKYNELNDKPHIINDLLNEGANKVRPQAKDFIGEIRDLIGISKI